MSDGPHRSLDMRRAWKKVAEIADNPAYSSEELQRRIIEAVAKDLDRDLRRGLLNRLTEILSEPQKDFLADPLAALSQLRMNISGALPQLLIDNVEWLVSKSNYGVQTIHDAMAATVSDWMDRHERQTEEHYRRKSSLKRADRLRNRTRSAISKIQTNAITDNYLSSNKGSFVVKKMSGLDDGVSI